MSTSFDATINGTITGPGGGVLPFNRSDSFFDSVTGFADLIPQASLRWNAGVHNVMTYITGDIPVGKYDRTSLSNLGLGHGAIDWGLGYTYFNPQTGQEFSAVGGVTYNYVNPSTNYQSGMDFHLDYAASQFLTKQVQVGLVGYVYHQLTGDISPGGRVGEFKITRDGYRAAVRLHLPDRHDHAGLPEHQGLQGIQQRQPAGGLEHVAHARAFASSRTSTDGRAFASKPAISRFPAQFQCAAHQAARMRARIVPQSSNAPAASTNGIVTSFTISQP
jgi:hypothetical protein